MNKIFKKEDYTDSEDNHIMVFTEVGNDLNKRYVATIPIPIKTPQGYALQPFPAEITGVNTIQEAYSKFEEKATEVANAIKEEMNKPKLVIPS